MGKNILNYFFFLNILNFFCLFVQFFRFVFEICIKHTENNRVAKS